MMSACEVSSFRPALTANEVLRKQLLRVSLASELVFKGMLLPASAVLPGVASMRGPLSFLSEARYGIVWM